MMKLGWEALGGNRDLRHASEDTRQALGVGETNRRLAALLSLAGVVSKRISINTADIWSSDDIRGQQGSVTV